MIEMRPSESQLPHGVKPLSAYKHGTYHVSNEKRIGRKTGRPMSHRVKSDHFINNIKGKHDVSTNNIGQR